MLIQFSVVGQDYQKPTTYLVDYLTSVPREGEIVDTPEHGELYVRTVIYHLQALGDPDVYVVIGDKRPT